MDDRARRNRLSRTDISMTEKTKTSRKKTSQISKQSVQDYLTKHPDFFLGNEALLEQLNLPTEMPGAVSLVQYQMARLRETNQDLKKELKQLLEIAEENEKLFISCRTLVLRLLEADGIEDLIALAVDNMKLLFELDAVSLILFNPGQPGLPPIFKSLEDDEQSIFESLLVDKHPFLGRVEQDIIQFLFETHADSVGSIAVVPITGEQILGVLALGSPEEDYFNAEMGSVFLSFTADFLAKLLPIHIKKLTRKQKLVIAD